MFHFHFRDVCKDNVYFHFHDVCKDKCFTFTFVMSAKTRFHFHFQGQCFTFITRSPWYLQRLGVTFSFSVARLCPCHFSGLQLLESGFPTHCNPLPKVRRRTCLQSLLCNRWNQNLNHHCWQWKYILFWILQSHCTIHTFQIGPRKPSARLGLNWVSSTFQNLHLITHLVGECLALDEGERGRE